MPTAAWISAAKQTDRKHVLLMAIESVNSVRQAVTTKADWDASKSITHCNTTTEPGTVYCATDGDEVTAGKYFETVGVGNSSMWQYIGGDPEAGIGEVWTKGEVVFAGLNNHVTQVSLQCLIVGGTDYTYIGTLTLEVSLAGGPFSLVRSVPIYASGYHTISSPDLPKGSYTVRVTFDPYGAGGIGSVAVLYATYQYQTCYLDGASLRTKTLNLGLVPTIDSRLQVDSYIPSGSSLAMTARGSNNETDWTDLGTVTDGSALAPFQYYDFDADLFSSADKLNSPELYEIRVLGGDSQFKYIGTHEDQPIRGVRPLLIDSLGGISSKLELMKLGTIGEISPKMYYCKETFELLRDGYLRDKAITLCWGFEGLDLDDYLQIFTGFWYDASIDLSAQTISVKTRTLFSRFQKAQVPTEAGGVRTAQTVQPKYFDQVNIVAAILDLLSYCGLPSRFIDFDGANAIMSGPRSGADWVINRTLDKDSKEDAITLLEELSVLSGITLTQQPDGMIRFDLYDPDADIDAEIISEIATIGPIEMGMANLYTRQQIFYDPKHKGDLTTGLVYGSWANLKYYAKGDSVPTQSSLSYHCLISHISAYINEPGSGGSWKAFWAPSWLAGQDYKIGDQVIVSDHIYVATSDHTSSSGNMPGVGTVWDYVDVLTPTTIYGIWNLNISMSANNSIIDLGAVWLCLRDHTTSLANRPGLGGDWRPYWTTYWYSGTDYVEGDVRISHGPLYTCRFSHTSSPDTEPGYGVNWRSVWSCQPVNAGNNDSDYYGCDQVINAAAEINWGLNEDVLPNDPDYLKNPGYVKKIYDKWGLTPAARAEIGSRMDSWFATPKSTTKLTDLPPKYAGLLLGKFIGLTGYILPSAGAEWGVPCVKKKFRIMGTGIDEKKCTVKFDILEV